MNLWFTGTRDGMSNAQKALVIEFLEKNKNIIDEIKHGDEIGAEYEFHKICYNLGLIDKIVLYPLNNRKNRALCKAKRIRKPLGYDLRKQALLSGTTFFLVSVRNYKEHIRVDCWSLVKAAEDEKIPVLIVFPDGSTKTINKDQQNETYFLS